MKWKNYLEKPDGDEISMVIMKLITDADDYVFANFSHLDVEINYYYFMK